MHQLPKAKPLIVLKFCIPTYFDPLIKNILMKIGGNGIFDVKTKKFSFLTFFTLR